MSASPFSHHAASCEPHTAPLIYTSPLLTPHTQHRLLSYRYEPNPAADVPRPAYIPRELHSQAGCVEIMYPEAGVARVWRVPRQDE